MHLVRSVLLAGAAVAVSITVAGCASVPDANQQPSPSTTSSTASARAAAGMATWFRYVGPDIADVEKSVRHAQRTVNRPGHPGLSKACAAMRDRVDTVRNDRAAPDSIVRHAVAAEMDDLAHAAHYCRTGQLLKAGRSVDRAHESSVTANRRILHLLHDAD